jgi:hypothetical protein
MNTKQWPLAPNLQDSLITRANVSRRVTFFSKMAFGKCRQVQHGLANVGESGKSVQHGLANVDKSGEYLPSLLMNVGSSKIGRFMHK